MRPYRPMTRDDYRNAYYYEWLAKHNVLNGGPMMTAGAYQHGPPSFVTRAAVDPDGVWAVLYYSTRSNPGKQMSPSHCFWMVPSS